MATQLKGGDAVPARATHERNPTVSAVPVGIAIAGLALLRQPFPAHQISKLPKPLKKDAQRGKCNECGGYHGLPAIHLDYVGHAALTDRLLDADPEWSWEPMSTDERGLPALDQNGGLWIKLTVCGVTRLGYGNAEGKRGGDAIKEIIGDALRNAAMRFGAALDLWHKGDLHVEDETGGHSQEDAVSPPPTEPERPQPLKGWREPDSIYSAPTKLHKGLTEHSLELRRIGEEGVFDDLETYMTSPEYSEFIRVAGKYAMHYLEGGPPLPEEYDGIFSLEQRAKDLIALRGNQPAYSEAV